MTGLAERIRKALRWRGVLLARKTIRLRRRVGRAVGVRRRRAGVNLVAYIRAEMGLGEAGRGLAAALEAAEMPFGIVNIEAGNPSRHTDMRWSHKEASRPGYDTTIVCVNPDNSYNLKVHTPLNVLGDAYVIGNWFWELPELPEAWTNDLVLYDEIWSPTRFVQAAVSARASCPVILIPPVVEMELSGSFPRSHFGLPERRFLFLAMADTRSVLERKNPLGVLRAFKQAFGTEDPTVGLVLKLNNPDWGKGLLRALKLEAQGCSNVFMVERTLSRPELNGLIALADCFVSLHRSEGFGLGPAEAMYLAKPAIVTNWSGNVDYMTEGNSVAIDYQLVPVGEEVGIYGGGQKWAEPDIEQAAHWMRRLRDDPALAEAIGRRGQETIRTNFSRQHVGSLIARRLSAIRR